MSLLYYVEYNVSRNYYNNYMNNYCKEISKNLALKIKLERVKRSWSQEQLSEYCNLNKNTIGKIERNQMSPTIETVAQIAYAFEMDIRALLDFSNM